MKKIRIRLWHLLLLLIPVALVSALAAAVTWARTAANESVCRSNPIFIATHLLMYRDAHGHFPPAALAGPDATPLHSWRAILYAELEPDFARAYNFAQPWDSPGNLKAAEQTPKLFACANTQGSSPRYTNYVAVVDRGVSTLEKADAIPRGSPEEARQVLLIEYPGSTIPWSRPRDLDVEDLAKVGAAADPGGIGVIFADRRSRRVPPGELPKLFGR